MRVALVSLLVLAACKPGGRDPAAELDGSVVETVDAAVPDAAVPAGPISASRLRVEYRVDPLGLDAAAPRLDWLLASDEREQRQTAYRVLAASSADKLAAHQGDLWDSGKVVSDRSTQVVYAGAALHSRQAVHWKVMVWDRDDRPSAWSPAARWEMGLLAASDWQAKWISLAGVALRAPMPGWIWFPEGQPATSAPAATRLFRRKLTLPATPIARAQLFVSVDDVHSVEVNGQLVGSASAWQTMQVFDLAGELVAGDNALAIRATNTSLGPAGVLAQLQIDFSDGAQLTVVSDPSWRSTTSQPAGWSTPGFDDSSWSSALAIAALGSGPWGTPSLGLGSGGGGPVRYLRRGFTVAPRFRRARLHATALGLYEATLNGHKIGAQVHTPGWTDYAKRLQVQTYDVSDLLQAGDNLLGIALADGWYQGKVGFVGRGQYGPGPIRAFAQLEIEAADGSWQIVPTDAAWTGGEGAIRAADLLDGEVVDARLEVAGWDRPGGTDPHWPAVAIFPAPSARLVAQVDDGVHVDQALPVIGMQTRAEGLVFDLGQNLVGWARLRVSGPAGATLKLRFAEVLSPDGSLYTTNLRGAVASDVYTLRGGGEEIYEPRFTSHGFRYVEVSGDLDSLTSPPELTGVVVHADAAPVGTFSASEPYLEQLHHNIVWSQKGNFTAVPTDCPQRDERLGWMGDAQIFAHTATLNMDVAAYFSKWTHDVADAQYDNGSFSEVAPRPRDWGTNSTPAWGDAGVIVPFTMYLNYGDERLLAEHYPAMTRWITHVSSANPARLWKNQRGSDYGDWLNIGAETDKEALATAFFAHSVDLVARSARVLGHGDDAVKFETLFAEIQAAFVAEYVTSDGHIRGDTQTIYALALRFGLLPESLRGLAGERLAQRIADAGGYLNTGFLGVGHLLPALTAAGHTELAYQLIGNRGFPSWRFEIDRGATTIWERWNGIKESGEFEDPGMNSFNHYSFGAVGEWMIGTIGGLALDEEYPGWRQFIVKPEPGPLRAGKASLITPYGLAASDWRIDADGGFTLTVTIPVGTRARIVPPFSTDLRLDGQPVTASELLLGSGIYVLTARPG